MQSLSEHRSKTEAVPTYNQRGLGLGSCRLWGGLDKAQHKVPTVSLVRVQRLRNDLYKAVEGPSTRLIVLSMITWSYFRRRRHLTILEPDETKFASHLTLLKLQTRSLEKTGWEIPSETNSWNNISSNLDKWSEYDMKNFPNVFQSLWYL